MKYLAGVAILVFLILWVVESCEGRRADAKLAAWQVWADSVKDATADSVADARRREQDADRVRAERDTLKVERVALLNRLAARRRDVPSVPTVAPDTCLPWLRKAEALEGVVATQDSAIQGLVQEVHLADQETAALRSANTTLHAAVDTLQAVIRSHPKPKGACRVLGVPCPVIGPGVNLGINGKMQLGLQLTFPLKLF